MNRAGLPWTQVDLACSETFTTDEFDQTISPTSAIRQLPEATRLRLCVVIDPAARSAVSREATTRDALVALVAALLVGAAISLLPIPALRPRLLLSRRWWARFGLRPRLCAAALLITMLVSIPLGAWLLAARPYRGIYNAPTGLVMTYVPGLVGAGFPWADGWLSQVPAGTLLTDSQDHPLVTMISSDGQVLYSTAGASVDRQLVPPPGWATTDQSLIPVTWPDDGAAADLSGQEITAVCGFARPLADVSLAMLFPGAQSVPSDATARSCVFVDPQAKRIDDVKIAAEILGWAALAGFGVAGFTWLIATLALAPLDRLRRQAAIGAGRRPTELVPVTGAGDAIDALADTFNESVVQPRQALESQRQFVADAAHELRSPITSLINALEVAERYPHLIDPRAVIDSSLTQSRRLAGLTQDLLLLARLDAQAPHELDRVELADLAATVVAVHVGARVPVRRTGGEVATVGDRLQLARMLVNLVDNAVRHADTAVRSACILRTSPVRWRSASPTTGPRSPRPIGSGSSTGSRGSTRLGPRRRGEWARPGHLSRGGAPPRRGRRRPGCGARHHVLPDPARGAVNHESIERVSPSRRCSGALAAR